LSPGGALASPFASLAFAYARLVLNKKQKKEGSTGLGSLACEVRVIILICCLALAYPVASPFASPVASLAYALRVFILI